MGPALALTQAFCIEERPVNDGSKENKPTIFDRALRVTAYSSGFAAIALSVLTGLDPDHDSGNLLSTDRTALESNRLRLINDNRTAESLRERAREKIRLGSVSARPQRDRDIPLHHDGLWFDRASILIDEDSRIDDAFNISPGLRDRVGFWFDIYSRYDSHKRVIHHSLFPWVIFKVVDVEPIISSGFPRLRWQRNQIADDVVKKELAAVRRALDSIAGKRLADLDSDKLSNTELQVYNALRLLLKDGKGDVRKLARRARHDVRVQTGQRNFFAEGLQTAPRYLGVMEVIFEKHRLPVELTRLPLVESSFNKHAKSKVGAAGIWQFMENTGRKKKLIINDEIDERKSPFKATDAAARLLKENYMILGRSWELAVTAWNHGPSGVKKASTAAGSRDLARIIQRYHSKRFDFASGNFYASFLAALYTERYSDVIFPGLPRHAPLEIQELILTRKMRVADVLKAASISMEEFESINPDLLKLLKSKRPLMKGLRIHIPSDAKSAVEYLMAGEDGDRRFIGASG